MQAISKKIMNFTTSMNNDMSTETQAQPVAEDNQPELDIELARLCEQSLDITPNANAPCRPVIFDPETCTGCRVCIELCPIDVLAENPADSRGIPIVIYPDECWYCGCCEMVCPEFEEGAIRMNVPLMQRVRWKRKETGEQFRLGMKNPPPPNLRKPV